MRFCLSTCRSSAPERRRAARHGKPSLPNRGTLMRNCTAEAVLPANLAEHRAVAGRWLGAVHRVARLAGFQAQLPDRGLSHYLQRLRSSRAALLERVGNPVLSAAEAALLQTVAAQLDLVESHWEEVERFSE